MKQRIQFCASRDGVRIAFATAGRGSPLVRVANWFTHLEIDWDSGVWAHWLDALVERRTLIRYDARGSGLSDRSVADLSLDASVADLEAVVEAAGLRRFPLIGLCQGGAVAVAYAARHPERVTRLALYDSYLHGAYVGHAPQHLTKQARTLSQMIEIGWGRSSGAFRELFASLLMPDAGRHELRWIAELQRCSASPEDARRLWDAYQSFDVRGDATRVRTPTLVFHARGDSMVPFDAGRHLAALIPEARFVPLESRNHILQANETAWRVLLAELNAFLGTVEEVDPEARGQLPALTARETQLLDCLARGSTNAEIAERLRISPKTVRNHITRIFSKLGVRHRSQAIVVARQAGLGRE